MELFCGIRAFEHAGWGLLASECDGYFLGANHMRENVHVQHTAYGVVCHIVNQASGSHCRQLSKIP